MKLDKKSIIAIQASLIAGKEIMNIYNKADNLQVDVKSDNSPLTIADKKANDIINELLIKTKIPIISEENKSIDYSTRKLWDKCWIVDPVDGTKEFINRNGEFTVNIALVDRGNPVFGVIYVPFTKTLYFGNVIGKESFKCELESHDSSILQVNESSVALSPFNKEETEIITIVGSRSHMNKMTKEFISEQETLGKTIKIISKGSSLKFCLVAEGKADIYPRFAPTMEWDTAAGQAICNAVGIDVISNHTNKPLLYNKENLLNPGFIVKKTT